MNCKAGNSLVIKIWNPNEPQFWAICYMNIVYQQFRTTGIKGFTRPLRWQHAELQELEGSEGFQTEAAPPYNGRITVSLSDAVHSLVQGQKTGGAGRIQGKTRPYRA